METILIVDDYEPLRRLYAKELGKDGYQVVAAKDFAEAMRGTKEHCLAAAIVEIGALAPVEFEMLIQTLSRTRKIPLIINTGLTGRCAIAHGDKPIDVWVTKSADLTVLKNIMKSLQSRRPLTGSLCGGCQFYEPIHETSGLCLLKGEAACPKWAACGNFVLKVLAAGGSPEFNH